MVSHLGWVAEHVHRGVVANPVSGGSGSSELEPLIPSQTSHLPVLSDSRAGLEKSSHSSKEAEHLDHESDVSSLGLEQLGLGEEVPLWMLDDILGCVVGIVDLFPSVGVSGVEESDPVIS